jgi:hypothetical protein
VIVALRLQVIPIEAKSVVKDDMETGINVEEGTLTIWSVNGLGVV